MKSSRLAVFRVAATCAWLALLPSAPEAAAAQARPDDIEQRLTPEQMHATGLDTLSPAQLQLLNRLLREGSSPAPGSPPPVAAAAVSAPSGSPTSAPGTVEAVASGSGTAAPQAAASPKPAVAPMFIGLDDQPIKSRIEGSVSGWAPGSEFVLENGQRWKVMKGQVNLPKPLQNPAITVIPGVAGRWFLQVDESMPSARVYRIE